MSSWLLLIDLPNIVQSNAKYSQIANVLLHEFPKVIVFENYHEFTNDSYKEQLISTLPILYKQREK